MQFSSTLKRHKMSKMHYGEVVWHYLDGAIWVVAVVAGSRHVTWYPSGPVGIRQTFNLVRVADPRGLHQIFPIVAKDGATSLTSGILATSAEDREPRDIDFKLQNSST